MLSGLMPPITTKVDGFGGNDRDGGFPVVASCVGALRLYLVGGALFAVTFP